MQLKDFVKRHWVKIALLAILIVFTSARIQTFGMSYINRDEPFYAWQSLAIYHNPEMIFSQEINYWYLFAVIPALAAPLNVFLEPKITVRVITFLFSLVAILFTYLVGKEIFSKKAGVAAALFLVLSPTFFFFSTKALPDIPLTALATITIYLLITLNKKRALLLPLLLFAMYCIKPASMVMIPPIAIFLIVKYRKRLQTKYLAGIAIAAAVVIAAAIFLSAHGTFRLTGPEFAPGWNYFKFGLLVLETVTWKVAGIPMMLFALIASIKLRKKMSLNTGLLVLWVFLTALPFFITKIWIALVVRYYLLIVPALTVIAGKGAAYLIEEKKYLLLGTAVLSSMALIFIPANYSNIVYQEDLNWEYTNETLENLETWIGVNVAEEAKLIVLSDEYMIRTMRLSAEKSLKNPRKQMFVNPTKEEFESIIEETGEYYLILENLTPSGRTLTPMSETWLYAQEVNWQEYLEEQDFEKVEEISPQNSYFLETYILYKKSNSR